MKKVFAGIIVSMEERKYLRVGNWKYHLRSTRALRRPSRSGALPCI